MSEIGTSDLAAQLPQILQGLAAGEEFLLTDAGRPVARILPALPSAVGRILSDDEWQKELGEWRREAQSRADRYPPGFVLDDSYEAIYGERENDQR